MVESLDSYFQTAMANKDSWSESRLRHAFDHCKEMLLGSYIDWEEGDENWGSLLKKDKVVLIASAIIPLAFVLSDYQDLAEVLGDCVVVPVASFSADTFSIDRKLLEQLVDREVSDNVNYDQLSIMDLWWATVT